MKNLSLKIFRCHTRKALAIGFLASCALVGRAQDTVYVTTFLGSTLVGNPPYATISGSISGSGSTEISAVPDAPARTRTRYGFANPVSWSLQPTLNVPGAIYKIETSHNSGTASSTSCSTDVLVTLTTSDGDLSASCTNTPVFQRSYGGPVWNTIGYITNHPGVTQPLIVFTYSGGTVDGSPNRLYIDAFKFTEVNPCSGVVNPVTIAAPLAANQTFVTVVGVDPGATNITVYADGSEIGQRSSGIVGGTNVVTTLPIFQGSEIKATQTKNGCTSALPASGAIVGGGANPPVKAFLTCWQSASYAGPIGTNSAPPATSVYYALKGSGLPNGSQNAPGLGEILNPSSCWQTITFDHSLDSSVRMDNGLTAAPYDPFCALDAIVFAINDSPDSGPYDIYIDQIKNGDVVIEDFESYAEGTTNRFSAPRNQPQFPNPNTTYLPGPNSSLISTNNAFDGTKSLRIRWQWNGTSSARWARIQANATSGKNYPQLDTSKPITIRYLVLPVGETTNQLHFATYPVNQTKTTNETAVFTAAAAGVGPFTYQWSFEGAPIDGATGSSYTKNNVQLSDTGIYSVLVSSTGGAGCSASTEAKLTVTEFVAPPTITYTWNGTSLQLNWSGSFNLESKTNLNDASWSNVGVSTGPYTVPMSSSATFYRLHNP